jgi:hypothetical protein
MCVHASCVGWVWQEPGRAKSRDLEYLGWNTCKQGLDWVSKKVDNIGLGLGLGLNLGP